MTQQIHPKSSKEWRKWLEKNHDKESKVFLVKYKRHTGKPTISHQESMDEAICYGWIDTTVKRLDEDRYIRCFARRNKNSRWSNATLSYAKRLIKEGKMTPAGLKMYKEGLKKPVLNHEFPKNPPTPKILNDALEKNKTAKKFFEELAPSYKRTYIYSILRAKLPETKQKRVKEIVDRCKKKLKPGL
jgi:uncharacterized protein YdeI (YjbR/CyaY-like superfamily)